MKAGSEGKQSVGCGGMGAGGGSGGMLLSGIPVLAEGENG